ncbi:unnamed protein product, partial [Adineta steineri]
MESCFSNHRPGKVFHGAPHNVLFLMKDI